MIGRLLQIKRVVKVGLIFISVLLVISLLSDETADDGEIEIARRKESVKLRRLQEYQKVVFKNNNRPRK